MRRAGALWTRPARADIAGGVVMAEFHNKTEEELIAWIGGWKQEAPEYIAGMAELARRQSKPALQRATIALWIAAGSLLLSVIGLLD